MSSNYESGQDHRVDDAIVKLDCLRRALEEIPDYYRQGVISSVKSEGVASMILLISTHGRSGR